MFLSEVTSLVTNRRTTRLGDFKYKGKYTYLVTLCTRNSAPDFGYIYKDQIYYSPIGNIVYEFLITQTTETAKIHKVIVHPNKIHIVIEMLDDDIILHQFIGQYKSKVIREIFKKKLKSFYWQRSFSDHIIRNKYDYDNVIAFLNDNFI